MASGRGTGGAAGATHPLPTRALVRKSGRARRLLAAGEWRPAAPDGEAAAAVLARLTAPLPTRRPPTHLTSPQLTSPARPSKDLTSTADRDRRLQRVLRTPLHHLDAGAVSPPAAALPAAVARAPLPWHSHPGPPAAAAAPRYGCAGAAVTPTEAGEGLLPELARLFGRLAAPRPPGAAPLTPSAVPWQVSYTGRFRRHGRPAPGVWTAETVRCPGCGGAAGPWTVSCDWRRITLGCPCGVVSREHGLALSEVWLVLPDV
ncbi:hypothetical protein [Streptomyces sp. NPDC053367]|uniref:hypothetical protein n=1 Tax=Streptomyces sp. NPDC053367 TaxID=3365700 RepID=UPI0037D25111